MSTEFSKIDAMTGADITIAYAHHEVHGGSSFRCSKVDDTMGDGDTIELAFKTPAGTKRLHMVLEYATLVGAKIELVEGPSWTTGTGAQLDIFNRKRESSPGSSIVLEDTTSSFVANDAVVDGPTALTGGTVVEDHYAWGVKNQAAAGGNRGINEIILQPDQTYAVVLTAIGNSNTGYLALDWYEHTDAA